MGDLTKLIDVQNQAWAIYHNSYFVIPGAPSEFRDLIDATTAVQDVIKLVDSAVIDPTHPLSASGPDAIHNVLVMCNAIRRTLEGVEKLVARYRKVAGPATDVASLSAKLWGKLKWTVERKAVMEFSARLRMHTHAVNLCLAVIAGATPEQIDGILEELFDELDEHRQKRVYEGIKLHMPATQEAVKRGPVELPAGQPVFVELDSKEIPRPEILEEAPVLAVDSSLPEVDVNKMRLAEADPAEMDEKQVAEETGLEVILQHESEEKIVVDQIMMQAERFLAQQGFNRTLSLNRRKTRRNIHIPRFNPTMMNTTQVPVIDQPMAITYTDLPPSYNIYSKMDIIGAEFNPGEKICETFRLAAAHNVDTPDWPKSTADWLRIAAWWLLKCRVAVDTAGVSQQTFVDWAKSSWILTEAVPPTPEQQAAMERDLQLAYTELWQQMKLIFFTHQASQMQPFTPTLEALNILEVKQLEEESRDPDPVILMDLFEALVTPDPHVRARCFVALDFGVIRPADAFAAPIDVHYLLLLLMDPLTQEMRITIYNQSGTVNVHHLFWHSDFSTEMTESNAHVWLEVDWNRRAIFAGFSSVQASQPYATARNWARRQLLERPRTMCSVDVERVRYLKESGQMATYSAASGWIGSVNLKLMEMRRAEDENQRYREIVVEGHFTTCNIPYHSIKMVPTGSNRITVFWPTFETPHEDLRDYINKWIKPKKDILKNFYAGRDQMGQPADDEWFMSHHIRHHSKSVTCNSNRGVLNVDIKFRPMTDRKCDIETSRQSERMIDILFHDTSDLQKFVRDFGGTAPWTTTEALIFHRTSATHQIYLFRELDGTMRLCFSQAGMYCNFFLDAQSGYLIDPAGTLSLWDLIWSPAANITRVVDTYLPDSLSLPMLDRPAIEVLITALFPNQTVAIIPITHLNGRKQSLLPSSRTMICPSATLLLVRTFSQESNTFVVRLVICGNIAFPYYATDPPIKEMRKMIAVVPPDYRWETTKAKEKSILVKFRGTSDVVLKSFSRERSRELPVTLFVGASQQLSRRAYAALCWALEFVVEEREWEYAMAVMGVQRAGVGGKKGVGSLVLGGGWG
ncbi:hypothetical protein EX30DRAFT_375516 [Ascodesmis nigricans]|uniref:Uncharacterized protein n=1 Tax=Ascodesmis nigricans TaxID=341454 RepID=A0A4S2MPH3_9PEZI|nr:hypothetical protein EX30DRAFT_375516 [Ascodesmis nigricans]